VVELGCDECVAASLLSGAIAPGDDPSGPLVWFSFMGTPFAFGVAAAMRENADRGVMIDGRNSFLDHVPIDIRVSGRESGTRVQVEYFIMAIVPEVLNRKGNGWRIRYK